MLNAVIAALRDGVMPLYNLFIVSQLNLNSIEIAWLMSAASASSFLVQLPIGLMYDRVKSPRGPLAGGLIGLAAASGLMFFARGRGLWYPGLAQAIFGIATAVLSQGIPAITVSETSSRRLGGRVARNEVFAKCGNFAALILAGYLTRWYSLRSVFVIIPVLVLPAVWLVLRAPVHGAVTRVRMRGAWHVPSRGVWVLLLGTFLLYLSSSAALTIFEQLFQRGRINGGASVVATGAGLAQAMITVSILSLASVTSVRGLTLALRASYVLIIARLLIMSLGIDVGPLMVSQVLDGVICGILFTIPMRLLVSLDREQFNVLSGLLGAAAALGALTSMFVSGYLMWWLAYPGALLVFIVPALAGLCITWLERQSLAANDR